MSIIKTVSLDETTDEIRKTIPNFSFFVRECLLRYAAQSRAELESCKYSDSIDLFDGRCNPLNMTRPLCFHCWPNGSPRKEDVKLFRSNMQLKESSPVLHDPSMDIEWLDQKAYENNQHLIHITNYMTRKAIEPTPTPRKSKLSQIWSIIVG
tara:strand:+ start:794 stop:1249 length:456 start_codon:yes stop_codon:yes gene_type:complete